MPISSRLLLIVTLGAVAACTGGGTLGGGGGGGGTTGAPTASQRTELTLAMEDEVEVGGVRLHAGRPRRAPDAS